MIEINEGPTVTQFGVEPLFVESRMGRTRVRVSKIVSLADDLALALAAPRIRIQAPVPGRNYVGIEVPNEEMALVALRDIMEGELFQRNKKPLQHRTWQGCVRAPRHCRPDLHAALAHRGHHRFRQDRSASTPSSPAC